jgi:hypothetical protein
MKRIKDSDIMPMILAPHNISRAIDAVLAGTYRKTTKQGIEII